MSSTYTTFVKLAILSYVFEDPSFIYRLSAGMTTGSKSTGSRTVFGFDDQQVGSPVEKTFNFIDVRFVLVTPIVPRLPNKSFQRL